MEKRYSRNVSTISVEENEKLKGFSVCVVGCGGLGGYVIELLGRLGIGTITAVDGDVFDETNLNRQILSSEVVIGKSKAIVAEERMAIVNSLIKINPMHKFLTKENCNDIIKGHDLVVDALDNISSRKILQQGCKEENIPMVHGAIAGWYGQVCVVMPGDDLLHIIYPDQENKGEEVELGNPSFTPALIASIEAAESVKILLNKGDILHNKMLVIDILSHSYEIFDI